MQTLPPTGNHTHTVIFLHGRGDTAKDFTNSFFESETSDRRGFQSLSGVRWVFPNAGTIYSKIFQTNLPQWFDMRSTDDPHAEEDDQATEIEVAVNKIQEIVAREVAVIGSENVVLGGISQGCAVGLHALLKQKLRLGGFVGVCGWLPRADALAEVVEYEAVKTPVFLGHAVDDETIAVKFGEEMRHRLQEFGMHVKWLQYDEGGHWFNEPKGIDHIVAFVEEIFQKGEEK